MRRRLYLLRWLEHSQVLTDYLLGSRTGFRNRRENVSNIGNQSHRDNSALDERT